MGGHKVLIGVDDIEKGPVLDEQPDQHQDQSPNTPRKTYYDRVEVKLQHQPGLESLCQFMDHSTQGFALNLTKRMSYFDIKVIHIPKSGKPDLVIKCTNLEDFEAAFSEDEERIGTMVIAKGLSRAMIEALGTKFDLVPEFFANHLAGTELYRMSHNEPRLFQNLARAPILLPEYIRRAPFYTAEFRRPYHIEGGKERILKLRSTEMSLPRPVQLIVTELPDVFVAEKISVYKKKGSSIGIILTDELLSDAPFASHIPSPVTFLNDSAENLSPDSRHHQTSSRRKLISWLQCLEPDEARAMFEDHSQLALRPILKIVQSNSVMFLAHARHLMTRIRTKLCDAHFPNDITFFLRVMRGLHRHMPVYQKLLWHALEVASLRGSDDIAEQKQDFGSLTNEMDSVLKALKEDVRFLVGEASIREGQIVSWLSKFAALFLPVSLLATILSISDPGYVRWAVLGGLGVPFVLISVFFMFFWKPAYFVSLNP